MTDGKKPDLKMETIRMHGALQLRREMMCFLEHQTAVSQLFARQMKLVSFPANDLFKTNAAIVKLAEDSKRMAAMMERLAPPRSLMVGLDLGRATRALGNLNLFQHTMGKELALLGRSFAGIPDSPMSKLFREQLRIAQTPYFRDLARTLQRSAEMLRPLGQAFEHLREDQRIAAVILELGIVPHGEIWVHFTDVASNDEDKAALVARLAHDCWPPLQQAIALDRSECMDDEKLATQYRQMLEAHGHGMHELVRAGLPGALERTLRVAYAPEAPPKIDYWIRQEVSDLPLGLLGGLSGFRVWKILVDHTFRGFKTDDHADAIPFPNRNTAAHGGGRQVAGVIDSLNAILLTHFVIKLAKVQRDYHVELKAERDAASA